MYVIQSRINCGRLSTTWHCACLDSIHMMSIDNVLKKIKKKKKNQNNDININ